MTVILYSIFLGMGAGTAAATGSSHVGGGRRIRFGSRQGRIRFNTVAD